MFLPQRYAGSDRRRFKPSMVLIIASVLAIGGIMFATLCPIYLRPHLASANTERFGAYAVLGAVLAASFRRRRAMVALFVVLLAFGLEAGQFLVPGRDARLADAAIKALGGVCGSSVVYASFPMRRLFARLYRRAALTVRAKSV